jgi:putative FmdB family regulatory protein
MPVYTYECEECGVRFTAKQSFTDAPIDVCPECSGHTHKVIGPVGVVFKGSGFYVTDSRSNRSSLTGSSKKKEDSASSETASAASSD